MKISEALGVARQIAEALEAAHDKGIVHRDLKPANVVLQGAGALGSAGSDTRAKVLDFGLAKPIVLLGPDAPTVHPAGSFDRTAEGRIVGTPMYMSPEQTRGRGVDKRTDIWAFGCVLFEMLSRQRPFESETATDTFARILEHEPDWSLLPPTTPAGARKLLKRCLEKDLSRRLRDIGDARLELEDAQSLSPGSLGSAGDDQLQSRAWHRWRTLAAVASAFIVGAAIAVVWLLQTRQSSLPNPLENALFSHGVGIDHRRDSVGRVVESVHGLLEHDQEEDEYQNAGGYGRQTREELHQRPFLRAPSRLGGRRQGIGERYKQAKPTTGCIVLYGTDAVWRDTYDAGGCVDTD